MVMHYSRKQVAVLTLLRRAWSTHGPSLSEKAELPYSRCPVSLLSGSTAAPAFAASCRIVQRGAVPPLINMLSHKDAQLKEMAAFALGRLAQAVDNQAGIVQASMPQML